MALAERIYSTRVTHDSILYTDALEALECPACPPITLEEHERSTAGTNNYVII